MFLSSLGGADSKRQSGEAAKQDDHPKVLIERSERRSCEAGRSPDGAFFASREAASLDDHPKGLTARGEAAEPRSRTIALRG